MSANKATVEKYLEGFRRGDHAMVLSCLTDDVVWELPGAFRKVGKEAVDGEIEGDCYQGHPVITVARMTEENGVVIAEGTVRTQLKTGAFVDLVFCDAFELRDGKIARIVSYLMEVKPPAS